MTNRLSYISTRGAAPVLDFDDVLLTGLARDGGLYVPDAGPSSTGPISRRLRGLEYSDAATRILAPFVAGSLDEHRTLSI